MSYSASTYQAKPVDPLGFAHYTDEEHAVWKLLFARQTEIIRNRASKEYLEGLESLKLAPDKVPQCPDVSEILSDATGWRLEPVPALISFEHFFNLLAHRRFPAATFIRKREDLDYIKEPDIFHEIFGHCPLLTHPAYAEFVHTYGQLGLKATPAERTLLARLFWFTVEFGLLNTPQGLRAYGGGILSSPNETLYALESPIPERKPFNVRDALRTAYRIDILQPIYYVLEDLNQLYELIELDLIPLVREAQSSNKSQPQHPC